MTAAESPSERAARLAREYRAGGPTSLLRRISDDGHPRLAHDLTMERYSADPQYSERVDAFLARVVSPDLESP